MSLWQALFLGFLQGATELFPVSSLGHAVLLPKLLGWNINQSDPSFVPYVVLLHLGTATALLVVFWEDWVRIVRAFFRAVYNGRIGKDPNERLAMLLFVGTIPTGLLGPSSRATSRSSSPPREWRQSSSSSTPASWAAASCCDGERRSAASPSRAATGRRTSWPRLTSGSFPR